MRGQGFHMLGWIIGIGALVGFGAALYAAVKDREKFFRGRIPTTHEQYGEEHFPECPELAAKLRQFIEDEIGPDARMALPDDKIVGGYLLMGDMDDVDFFEAIETEFQFTFPNTIAEPLITLRDLTRYLESKGCAKGSHRL